MRRAKKKVTPLPTTVALLDRIRRPKRRSVFDRIEIGVFLFIAVAIVVTLVTVALQSGNIVQASSAQPVVVLLIALVIVAFLFWAISQLLEMILALKAGFTPAAEAIDASIEYEQVILSELCEYRTSELRERAKHLELKIKRLNRRAGLVTLLTAVSVVAINILDVGQKSNLWKSLDVAKLYVYTASAGLLIGSIFLVIFSGRLEQVAGLLTLAADREGAK